MFGRKRMKELEEKVVRLEVRCNHLADKCDNNAQMLADILTDNARKKQEIDELKQAIATLERKVVGVRKPQAERDDRPNISYEFGPKHTIHPNEDYKQ